MVMRPPVNIIGSHTLELPTRSRPDCTWNSGGDIRSPLEALSMGVWLTCMHTWSTPLHF